MSTSANLRLTDGVPKVFSACHDATPSNVIPDVIELAEEAQNKEPYFQGMLLDDWLATGYGWSPNETMYADYEYELSLKKREIKWINEGETVVVVNYQAKSVKFWNGETVSYQDLNELSDLLYKCEEQYWEEKEVR